MPHLAERHHLQCGNQRLRKRAMLDVFPCSSAQDAQRADSAKHGDIQRAIERLPYMGPCAGSGGGDASSGHHAKHCFVQMCVASRCCEPQRWAKALEVVERLRNCLVPPWRCWLVSGQWHDQIRIPPRVEGCLDQGWHSPALLVRLWNCVGGGSLLPPALGRNGRRKGQINRADCHRSSSYGVRSGLQSCSGSRRGAQALSCTTTDWPKLAVNTIVPNGHHQETSRPYQEPSRGPRLFFTPWRIFRLQVLRGASFAGPAGPP